VSAVALDDVKTHLNSTGAINEAELQGTIDAAEAAISRRVGPLETVDKTARVRGGGLGLRLPVSPAESLTSVTPVNGTALTLADLYLDQGAGVVTYNNGSAFCAHAYDVVYVAGRSECPDDLLLAVKELVRHMWDAQRGPVKVGPLQSDALSNTLPGSAYTFPIRVTELLAPHLRLGFA
jgi:hypothetical protein